MLAFGSWRGTGATTTALATAAAMVANGQQPLLIEADPAGGVLAARLHVAAGGLEQLAFPAQRLSITEHIAQHAVSLGGVRVITASGDPFRAFAAHAPRLPWAAPLADLAEPTIVDLGRIRAGSPVWHAIDQSDHVVLVTSTEVAAVVSTAEWIATGGRVSPAEPGFDPSRVRVCVVESPSTGESFSRSVVEREFAERLVGWLPWAPKMVDLLHRGATFGDHRLGRTPFGQAALSMARVLLPAAVSA